MNTFGMVFSTMWLEFKDMAQDPLIRREPVSASCNRRPDEGLETQKYSLYPNEHPANCPLWWRLSNGLQVYLSWLQAGFSHHTRQHNWWSVHERRFPISCCPPFRQPPTSYKACVYGWQRQASSFKSSNRLPSKRRRDFCSLGWEHQIDFKKEKANGTKGTFHWEQAFRNEYKLIINAFLMCFNVKQIKTKCLILRKKSIKKCRISRSHCVLFDVRVVQLPCHTVHTCTRGMLFAYYVNKAMESPCCTCNYKNISW